MIFCILWSLLCFSIGASKGVCDVIKFHYGKSWTKKIKNHKFWNPEISWMNKYSDSISRKEKFLGSTTIFVTFTDAWHLFQFIQSMSIVFSFPLFYFSCIYLSAFGVSEIYIFLGAFLAKIFIQIGFVSTYR
jgi:hypothetical protein